MLYVKLKTWQLNDENFTLEMKEAYRKFWPQKLQFNKPAAELTRQDIYGTTEQRLTYEEAVGMQEAGWEMELEGHSEMTQITKMRGSEWNPWGGADPTPKDMIDGRSVQITIPDLGLMLIDEVEHLNDCCTDELQRYLNNGWRILAVCPPCAQRRPDYILGRRKPKE